MISPRLAIASARPALRRGALAARAPRLAVRNASSNPHSGNAGQVKSSDTPWAIASAVVFGSLFVYLTSPASKTHNEHGHITGGKSPTTHGTGSSRSDDKTGDEAVWKQEDGHEASEHQYEVEHDEDTPEGDKHLKASRNPDKGAHSQKSPSAKERDQSNSTSGIENSNFKVSWGNDEPSSSSSLPVHLLTRLPYIPSPSQHGIAASKDGEHISNPKEVVAKAQSDRQDKKADKETQQDVSEKSEKDEGADSIPENEGAE
jgi:hypothetical protein